MDEPGAVEYLLRYALSICHIMSMGCATDLYLMVPNYLVEMHEYVSLTSV